VLPWTLEWLSITLASLSSLLKSRAALQLENVALRHQLGVFQRSAKKRLLLNNSDRLLWIGLSRVWTEWRSALVIVKPDTIHQAGRPKVKEEIRQLIRRMGRENPSWGASRIHGELLLLGFEIAEPTVSRYLQRLNRIPQEDKAKRWRAFLNNDREVIAAFDLFTVPTLSFRTLYRFFAIEHGRRRILQFNVTLHPTSDWIVQQLREAFPLIVLIHTFYSTTMPSSAIRC
jgi:putative transposase